MHLACQLVMTPRRTLSLLALLALLAFGGAASSTAASSAGTTTATGSSAAAESRESAQPEVVVAETPAVDPVLAAKNREASRLLSNLAATYEHLDGVTVTVAETPKDEQAVAYYTDGQIVISPTHEASVDEILAHEVWHVIDWRDNGQIDWGEDLPPSNSSDYLSK